MPVGRLSPGQPMGFWRDEFDRLVSDFFRTLPGNLPVGGLVPRGYPAVNLWETNDEYFAEAEVPGLREDEVNIYVVGSELTIKGERSGAEVQQGTYHRCERETGSFTRVVHLPGEVDGDRVEANLKDGVLLIKLPKSEAAKPRKIQVSAKS